MQKKEILKGVIDLVPNAVPSSEVIHFSYSIVKLESYNAFIVACWSMTHILIHIRFDMPQMIWQIHASTDIFDSYMIWVPNFSTEIIQSKTPIYDHKRVRIIVFDADYFNHIQST